MKLFNKNKFWQRFDKVRKSKMTAMKIQDGVLSDVMWRYSWGMIVAMDLSHNA